MSAAEDLHSARVHLAAGHVRRALSAAWRAADAALLEGDSLTLQSVIPLAEQIGHVATGGQSRDAEQLASYCTHALDGAGGGVESHSILSRISRWRQPRRTCPDCAEQISAQARVCRYCGFRFDTA